MNGLNFPSNATVKDIFVSINSFIRDEQRKIWPLFKLKIVAIKCDNVWQCLYFGIAGCFESSDNNRSFERENFLILVLEKDSDFLWQLIEDISKNGSISIDHYIINMPKESAGWPSNDTYSSYATVYGFPDIVNASKWWLMWVNWMIRWDRDNEQINSINFALRDEISNYDKNEPDKFFAKQIGRDADLRLSDCIIEVALPLPVKLNSEPRRFGSNLSAITIYGRAPLTPKSFRIEYSPDSFLQNEMSIADVEDKGESSGWHVGTTNVPIREGKLWLRHNILGKLLIYEIKEDPLPKQMSKIIGLLYKQSNPDEGEKKWKKQLLTEKDSNLEVVLLNSIVRFGWPVLFCGCLPKCEDQSQPQESSKTGGPQTEGVDLIVIDSQSRRALLINVKGLAENNFSKIRNEESKIAPIIDKVKKELQYDVSGLVICNKIPSAKAETLTQGSIRFVGSEWVQEFSETDDKNTAERLLWEPTNFF